MTPKHQHGSTAFMAIPPRLQVGDKANKVGGSYQASGVIKAVFSADDGSARYVFRFDSPAGLLHIFSDKQLEKIN